VRRAVPASVPVGEPQVAVGTLPDHILVVVEDTPRERPLGGGNGYGRRRPECSHVESDGAMPRTVVVCLPQPTIGPPPEHEPVTRLVDGDRRVRKMPPGRRGGRVRPAHHRGGKREHERAKHTTILRIARYSLRLIRT